MLLPGRQPQGQFEQDRQRIERGPPRWDGAGDVQIAIGGHDGVGEQRKVNGWCADVSAKGSWLVDPIEAAWPIGVAVEVVLAAAVVKEDLADAVVSYIVLSSFVARMRHKRILSKVARRSTSFTAGLGTSKRIGNAADSRNCSSNAAKAVWLPRLTEAFQRARQRRQDSCGASTARQGNAGVRWPFGSAESSAPGAENPQILAFLRARSHALANCPENE